MKKINILVPDLPESISDATVVKWHKKIGEIVSCNDNVVDIETDKVMLEVSSPCNGRLQSIIEKEGNIVKSQQLLGEINQIDVIQNNISNTYLSEKKYNLLDVEKNVKNKEEIEFSLQNRKSYLSPSIRRFLKINEISENEKPIFFQEIHNKENINIQDNVLDNHLDLKEKSKEEDNQFKKRVKMTRLRQRIGERLLYSQKNTAMLTTFNEVNMKPIMLLRKKYSEIFEKKYGIRMGFMSFFVKAVVQSLKNFPQINAYIDKQEIVFHNNFDISIAISTPKGLITPVLRNSDKMTMSEIEKKIKEFSIKGSEDKINIQELIGGNFTITNGGIFGSLMSTPIINPPQSAILGMHVIQERPIVINGKIKILPMMYLALSYDHCLIDGKESVAFLINIKNILEDFTRIIIDI